MARFILTSLFCLSIANGCLGQIVLPVTKAGNIINDLDRDKIFGRAIIGVHGEGYDSDIEILSIPSQTLYLSIGFSVESVTNCNIRLHNPQARAPYVTTESTPYNNGSADFFAALYNRPAPIGISLPLYDLDDRKGRHPYLSYKTGSYGKWVVQIKARRGTPVEVFGFESAFENETRRHILSKTVTFGFDNESDSRKFDAAFREALKICQYYKPPKPNKPKWPIIVN